MCRFTVHDDKTARTKTYSPKTVYKALTSRFLTHGNVIDGAVCSCIIMIFLSLQYACVLVCVNGHLCIRE